MDFTDYAYTKDLDIAKVQHTKKAPNREAMALLHAWSTVSQDILKHPQCIEDKDTLSMRGTGWQYSLLRSLRPAIGLYLKWKNRYLKCHTEKSSSSTYHRPRPLQKPRWQRPTSCHINRVWWLEQLWSQVWWRHSWNTSSWSLRHKDQDFKARLHYMVIFLTDWATEWDHVSKSQNETFF